MRAIVILAALALCGQAALACEGQTGKVIFEDKFEDDSGGWSFGEATGFTLNAPGATLDLSPVSDGSGSSNSNLNQTFSTTLGDFCVEGSFPANQEVSPGLGLIFWATDYTNNWAATAYASGDVRLASLGKDGWNEVFTVPTKGIVKTGPKDVNSVRVIAKNGSITVMVNGQKVKTVRAQIPTGNLKFGVRAGYQKDSDKTVLIPIVSYKVTE